MDKFWSKVDKREGGCWLWLASRDTDGYGHFAVNRKIKRAHQVSYALAIGEIPTGMEIDHLCRNRACVNPDHLEAVTHKTNMLRGAGVGSMNAEKTHCQHGHEFTPENTYIRTNGNRDCRTCGRHRMRAYVLRKKVG